MPEYLIEMYRTEGNNCKIAPQDLSGIFESVGLLSERIPTDDRGGAAYSFYGHGIAGIVYFQLTAARTFGTDLEMQVKTNQPKTPAQQDAVIQLLLQLPMFHVTSQKRITVPKSP